MDFCKFSIAVDTGQSLHATPEMTNARCISHSIHLKTNGQNISSWTISNAVITSEQNNFKIISALIDVRPK